MCQKCRPKGLAKHVQYRGYSTMCVSARHIGVLCSFFLLLGVVSCEPLATYLTADWQEQTSPTPGGSASGSTLDSGAAATHQVVTGASTSSLNQPSLNQPDSKVAAKPDAANDAQQNSAERLEEILDKREHDSFTPDFALGPGDVLQISVPDVEEIKDRTERVSAQGTIELPIAGTVHVGGLTESQAKAAVIKALSKYVKDPQADIFVKEYASRQVAVTGMVNKPGLYTLNSRDDTIMEMIGRPGGMTDQAGSSRISEADSRGGPGGHESKLF